MRPRHECSGYTQDQTDRMNVSTQAEPPGSKANCAYLLYLAPLLNQSLTTAREDDSRFYGKWMGGDMHTAHSAARAAGVTKSAIYRAIKSGRLSARKLNGGSYAIYPAELLRAFPSLTQAAFAGGPTTSRTFGFPLWDVG